MDTDQLISHSRARFEHETARRTLREKYQAKFTFAYAGGMWQAGPELINTLSACLKHGQQGLVILDMYETPVKVDAQQLYELAVARWQEQLNAWLVEYEQLNRNR